MRIKKISGTAILNGNVVDGLEDNSTTNAPSQRAVNEAIATIIESGSNENGSYVKYSDGTMICSKTVTGSSPNSGWWSFCQRTNEKIQVNFPATFKSIESVVATPTDMLGGLFTVMVSTKTTSYFAFTGLRANGTTVTNYSFDYIAFGKWK